MIHKLASPYNTVLTDTQGYFSFRLPAVDDRHSELNCYSPLENEQQCDSFI